MAERRHGSKRSDARGGGRGGGRGDLRNEEAARQRDLHDIENDDLRQQTNIDDWRDWRCVRGKSNPMRSIAPECCSMDDPLFNGDFTSYDADETSKNSNSNIFSMPVYDTHVYDEDILYELPGLMSKSMPPSVKFDGAAEDEGVAVDDDEELEGIVVPPQRKGEESDVFYSSEDVSFQKSMKLKVANFDPFNYNSSEELEEIVALQQRKARETEVFYFSEDVDFQKSKKLNKAVYYPSKYNSSEELEFD
ncbi:hypothetical protein SASPL_126919 [Salvia splendens]|uniref:Uncharacterized protein n=1 Tax=Salvia splendens TaxID=180675 RepID=A0A8X8XHU5_SALSN|nr:hypothetical protein SASPL_126919 [Salvia splendens]